MRTILLVDDNPGCRDIGVVMVRAMGYNVALAKDGAEAVAQAIELIPDLIVTDINMPVLNGLEALTLLRQHERTRTIPVIAVTGNVRLRADGKFREYGFDGLLGKPFSLPQLKYAVGQLLPGPAAVDW